MSSRLEGWLARLSDPAGPNERWRPPPFGPGDLDHLPGLVDLAGRHNVRPVLVANLERQFVARPEALVKGYRAEDRGTVDGVLQEARDMRLTDIARAMLLENAAKELFARIEPQGLPVVLVKGIDFAKQAYGGLHLRTFSDIDLLVDPAGNAALGKILAGLGYEELVPHKMRWEKTERQWIRRDQHDNVILVEVHTDMVHDPALRRVSTLTYQLYTDPSSGGVTPASRLVLAALHGAASHLFGRLQYAVDGLMIARMGVDPAELEDRAYRTGSVLPLATMLRLTAEIYDCGESRKLLERLGSIPWNRLQNRLITPASVLAAKGLHRWRLLPQRYLYRRLLQTAP